MRRLLITLFFTNYLIFLVAGQSAYKLQLIAEQYFNQQRYGEAAMYYEEIVGINPKDISARYQLAECFYLSLQYSKAIDHYRKVAMSGDSLRNKGLHMFGLCLKLDGQYNKADSVFYMVLSRDLQKEELRNTIMRQKEGCQLAIRQAKTQRNTTVKMLGEVNTDAHEYAATVNRTTNQLVLLTTRKLKSRQYADQRYGGFLPDLLSFDPVNSSSWKVGVDNSGLSALNTPYAEGSGNFTADGKKFYFTSCSTNQGSECLIYVSKFEDGVWTSAQALPSSINRSGFQSQHPFISHSGDTLFFASNREGGSGGMDIWMSIKGKGENWMPAVNMGTAINTPDDEISPYYSDEFRALVFASKGHVGYGGYDLYLAKGITFYEPQIYNLGPPFNSSLDDVYFNISYQQGFFSSNRGDKRDMDIYRFDVEDEVQLLGSFMSEDDISDRRMALAKYRQLRSLDLHTFRTDDFLGYEIYHPIPDKTESKTPVSRFNFVNVDGQIADQFQPVRIFLNDSLELLTLSDRQGKFSFKLLVDSLHNLDYDYSFRSDSEILSHHLVDTSGIFFPHFYENLYFDFSSSELRPEAKIALDELLTSFKSSEVALIDIQTHTDDIGNLEFNFRLSEERGLSIVKYLSDRGFPPSKLRVVAHGEKNPRTKNVSWYSRLYNRRAEITIYNETTTEFDKPEIFIVRNRISLDEAALLLGIDHADIIARNGENRKYFEQGHVLRVLHPVYFVLNIKYLIEEKDLDHVIIPYIVKPNDTLDLLSRQFRVPEEFIVETNHLEGELKPGQEIIIYQLDRKIKAPQL